jgi:hypothetical protein
MEYLLVSMILISMSQLLEKEAVVNNLMELMILLILG